MANEHAVELGKIGRSRNTDAQAEASRANGKRGGRPIHTLRYGCKVGIYDSAYVARIYSDKIIVVSPYVKWVGNTGGYAESKQSIRDQRIVDRVIQELADDCETSAWNIIGGALDNEYLQNI